MTLAYVTGLIRSAGWTCRTIDLSIWLYHLAADADKPLWDNNELHLQSAEFLDEFWQRYQPAIEAELARLLQNEPIDLVGLSVRSQNRHFSLAAARHIKKLRRDLPILFGGSDAYRQEYGCRFLSEHQEAPDMVLLGEAEIALPAFLREFSATKRTTTKLAGFAYRGDGGFVENGEPELPDLKQATVVADFSQFDFRRYRDPSRFGVFSSRGCINRCAFCNEHSHFRRFRARDPKTVVAEIQQAMPLAHVGEGRAQVAFYDSIFNATGSHVRRLCEAMIDARLNVTWGAQVSFSVPMDRPLLEIMHRAGCRHCFWGMESGSQRIVDAMHKRFTLDAARQVIGWASDVGIHSHLPIIVGFPGETPSDVVTTARLVRGLRGNSLVHFPYVSPIVLVKNSEIERLAPDYGIGGTDFLSWYSTDGRNTRAVRVFRTFFLRSMIENEVMHKPIGLSRWRRFRTFFLRNMIGNEALHEPTGLSLWRHLNLNDPAMALEIATTLWQLAQESPRSADVLSFLSGWGGKPARNCGDLVVAHWHSPELPETLSLANWLTREKNTPTARERILQVFFEVMQDAACRWEQEGRQLGAA